MSKMYKQDGATLEANPVSKLLPVPGILRPIQYMNALIFTYECKTAAECIRLLDTFDMTKKAASARTNALDIMCEPRWFIRRDKKQLYICGMIPQQAWILWRRRRRHLRQLFNLLSRACCGGPYLG